MRLVRFGDAQATQNGKPAEFGGYMLANYASGGNVLGDVYVAGQRAYWAQQRGTTDTFASPRMYLNTMTFAGDPSLRIKPIVPTSSPTVRGLSPSTGVGAGGTSVAIDGTNFDVNSTRVLFGSKPATVVNCPTPSLCYATSPPGAGTVDVSVISGYGQFAATSASTTFRYQATAPTCTIATPSCGSVWLSCESTPDALSYQWQNVDGTWGNPIMFAGQASISGLLSANPYAIRFCAGNALGTVCGNAQSFSPDLTGRLTSCTATDGSKLCGMFANNCGGTLDCGSCPAITTCAGNPKPLSKCSTSWRCCDSDGWTCGFCQ